MKMKATNKRINEHATRDTIQNFTQIITGVGCSDFKIMIIKEIHIDLN